MARSLNKTCSKCGYQTHRLFDITDEGECGICADCVVDLLLHVRDEEEHPKDDDVFAYLVEAIVADAEQA